MEELFAKYPWRSKAKLLPIALKHGFKEKDVNEFLKKKVVHDKHIKANEYYLPIYGTQPGVYQFDTLCPSAKKGGYFLILIEINSKKGYAYPMKNKGSDEVYKALSKFLNEAKPKEMTSDQDAAYLSNSIINLMVEHGIDYRTTDDYNHNILGVINRFIRTLRDLNDERDFTNSKMKEIIDTYNDSIHSATGKAPNEFTNEDQNEYIYEKEKETEKIKNENWKLNKGERVRIVNERGMTKRRSNISKEYYLIDSTDGNAFIVKARDESIARIPRHKLVKGGGVKYAETLDDGKRGIVESIEGYNKKTDKYKVKYSDNSYDYIKSKNLRERRPTKLSDMEREYWNDKNMPDTIKRFA